MLGALLCILTLIFAAAWLARRAQRSYRTDTGHLRTMSVLPLSAKERVVLIQAGAEQVLIGVSAAGIQHLHTLAQPIGEETQSEQATPASPMGFAASLRTMMNRARS